MEVEVRGREGQRGAIGRRNGRKLVLGFSLSEGSEARNCCRFPVSSFLCFFAFSYIFLLLVRLFPQKKGYNSNYAIHTYVCYNVNKSEIAKTCLKILLGLS
jgi:MFS family permease